MDGRKATQDLTTGSDRSHHRPYRAGFTLIEVLVVVAIIALLISILLPSLSRARETARSTQCLSSLKQVSYAIMMYTVDNRDSLPGPIHLLLYQNTGKTTPPPGSLEEQWFRQNLPYFLAKYMGDRKARNLDKVATCPSAEKISVASSAGQPWFYQERSYYIANTGSFDNPNIPGQFPYYATDPPNLFGYLNLGQKLKDFESKPYEHELRKPKKLGSINRPADEWGVADLWYWEGKSNPRARSTRVGTWPYDLGEGVSGSVSNGGRLKIPSYPYHGTTRTFDPEGAPAPSLDAPRLTAGRTNTNYLDGHAASVKKWKGSAHPYMNN